MKINKLVLKNIRSYKNQEIDFPTGSILLAGDIGAGKTTILLAIEFALFGLQPGQRGSSLLSNGENEGSITLEILIGNTEVTIERYLKRTSKTISQDSTAITIDGVKTEMSITEIKTKILELLGYPEEFLKKTNLLYRYTVYSPQEEMKQIIQEDAETRLDMLRHIFGIDKYRKIKDNLLLVSSNLRERARALQSEIKNIEEFKTNIAEASIRIVKSESSINQAESQVNSSKLSRKKIESDLLELKDKIIEKQRLEKEIEKTNVLISNKMQYLG